MEQARKSDGEKQFERGIEITDKIDFILRLARFNLFECNKVCQIFKIILVCMIMMKFYYIGQKLSSMTINDHLNLVIIIRELSTNKVL